ncbi:response regulator [Nodosilinea sp. LEGE 07088]|uniref:hybrid sensor histidine kinase/response regulator n=1 Tax=Nodosilinea sp. LEGE 07088 TaxID=2777968 RepID=UPI00187F4137|nr:hybrid sensor histidine kinase/response regulator [Nodosilinea sp. LEGE 07088]MBE9139025.1 response regulator [Nodosilinea sp. LEGE 07088]
MLPEDQKRILGYFIEEAKDHLNTIEQGLLNLAMTVNDAEMMNEVFRAAHSVKGGAAMLGLNSIQRTSHRMEDFFKVMKESTLRPDRDLETMLLQIFDGLQEQLEQLQSPFGLTNDQAQEIMTPLEPVFAQAEAHLEALVSAAPAAATVAPTPASRPAVTVTHPETSALQLVFRSDIPALLRDMLTTFKQVDDGVSRQDLGRLCQRLQSIGEQFELTEWCALIRAVNGAIANSQQTYRTLAPVVIKDLKQAQDLVLAGSAHQISVSANLQALLPTVVAATEDSTWEALLAEALNDSAEEPDLADLFAAAEATGTDSLGQTETDSWLDQLALDNADDVTDTGLEAVFSQMDEPTPVQPSVSQNRTGSLGPEVGAAELNSLADLFEGATDGLADIWEEDDDLSEASLSDLDRENLDTAVSDAGGLEAEFADLLGDDGSADEPEAQPLDDMASLFGYDLDASAPSSDVAESVDIDEPHQSGDLLLDPLADFMGDESAPAAPIGTPVANDSLDDLLATDPAASAAVEGEPLDDNFFELGDTVDEPAIQAVAVDGLDSFFEDASGASFIDDDDAHTMPELNLEVDSEPSSSAAESDNGLFTDSNLREPAAPRLESDDVDITADDWFLESDPGTDSSAEEEDPFGEFEFEDGSTDLAAAAPLPVTAADGLTTAQVDNSLDILLENEAEGDGIAITADSALGASDDSFEGLEGLLESAPADEVDALTLDETDLDLSDVSDSLEEVKASPDLDRHDNGHGLAPITDDMQANEDGFDDLEALLGDDLLSSEQPVSSQGTRAVDDGNVTQDNGDDDLDKLLDGYRGLRSQDNSSDDEFGDLEKLLEDADQLGGSAPTLGTRRTVSMSATRRSPRRASNTADQTMRVSVGHLDTLSNLVGELVVNRNSLEQDQERLRQFLDNLLNQVSQLNDVGQRMRDLYERSLLESSLIANRQAFALGVSSDRSSNSHATGATFDALEMDRFTGFHTLSQEMIELIVRVREASSDIEFTIDSTDQIARQFRQVTTQLQEGLNKARMVPFGQTADRLPRAVRDISLRCGKEAQLVVEGRDTLIDKMILERFYDPMTHLVNNAITHGIESPEERLATGKSREGTITVRAFYQGNQTVIYIADNGGGVNPAIVKAKALAKGLITPAEAQTMSEIEVYDLLFLPGFSTRDQADDFSGRGVGMDVVRTALTDIRGSITVESEVGKGTSFTIRLPLTLSITKALSCVNNQARIAFPMDGVEDMFDVPKERIQTDDQGHACILWRDTLLPFRPLGELLRFNRSLGRGRVYGGPQDEDVVSMVVLRSASTFMALQVDQVIGEQEIVIKQLEGPVPKPVGIAGATVLGDGRVMPIADVLELIDLASGRLRRDSSTSLWTQDAEVETPAVVGQNDPTVLIVDDSITVRELLSMSFNKVGYRVEQARDGQEAWEKLRSGLPCDLVFCDIEMPRMDGLELLSRMQKDGALSQIPIAMLTSRGADRHRQMAVDLGAKGYFTKPYLEEMLLDAAQRMLKGENMVPRKIE